MSPHRGDGEFYDPERDVIYLGAAVDTNPAALAKLDRLLRSRAVPERTRSRDWPQRDDSQPGPSRRGRKEASDG